MLLWKHFIDLSKNFDFNISEFILLQVLKTTKNMLKLVINGKFLSQKITGVQKFAFEISKNLQKLDKDILILAPKNILPENRNCLKNVVSFGNFTGVLWEQMDLPLFLKKLGNPILLNLISTAPLFYYKNIYTLHDIAFTNKKWVSKSFYYYYNFLCPKLLKKAKFVITVSNFSKNEISKYFNIPQNKIFVVHNASNTLVTGNEKPIYDFQYLLTVASLNPRKNLIRLIRAYQAVKEKIGMKLVIVGQKNPKIFGKVNIPVNDENIIFTGYVDDFTLTSLYKYSHAFIFPSLYEGFGIPPLEALTMGVPVAVAKTASLPEIYGDAVYYFDPFNKDEIAGAIIKITMDKNLRQKILINRHKLLEKYSWEKSAKKLLKLINNL